MEPYPKRSSFSSINVPFTYGSRITTWKSIFLLYQVNSRSISKARTADLSARHKQPLQERNSHIKEQSRAKWPTVAIQQTRDDIYSLKLRSTLSPTSPLQLSAGVAAWPTCFLAAGKKLKKGGRIDLLDPWPWMVSSLLP